MQLGGNPGSRRPVAHVIGERSRQSQVVEHRRPQLPHQMLNVAIEALHHRLQCPDFSCRRQADRGTPTAGRQPVLERRQLFAELVVHLACDAAAFVLLGEHQPREQLGPRALGFRLLPLREIEVRADDADHGPAGSAAHRKPARQHVDVVPVLVLAAGIRLRRWPRRFATLSCARSASDRSSGCTSRSQALTCGSISSSA